MSDGRTSRVRLYSLVALMVLFWSANFVVGKYVLQEIPALLVVGLRTLIGGFAMALVYGAAPSRSSRWTRDDLGLLLVLGVVGIAANQLFFVLGLSRTSASHAAIMIGLSPLLVLTIAATSGLERLSPARLLGMLVALGGVAVVQTGASGGRSSTFLGDLFVFLAALAFAIFTVRGKSEIHRLGSVTVNAFGYIISAILFFPMTVWLGSNFDFSRVTAGVWIGLVYMAIFPSVVCYLIYYHALAHIPASRLSALAYLQPVLATLIAIPILGEYPSRELLTGGAMVFAGVFLAERL